MDEDSSEVLGVDDGRDPGHGPREIGHCGFDGQEPMTRRDREPGTLVLPYEIVVGEAADVRFELGRWAQPDEVSPVLTVDDEGVVSLAKDVSWQWVPQAGCPGLPITRLELVHLGQDVAGAELGHVRVDTLEADDALFVNDEDRAVGCTALLVVHAVRFGDLALGVEVRDDRVRYVPQ